MAWPSSPIGSLLLARASSSASDSALDTLVQRDLVEHKQLHLLVTARAFLELANLKDLADLPPLGGAE